MVGSHTPNAVFGQRRFQQNVDYNNKDTERQNMLETYNTLRCKKAGGMPSEEVLKKSRVTNYKVGIP